MAYTHLDPGRELEVSNRAVFSSAQADIAPLVQLPPETLKALEEASVQKERSIFSEMEGLSAKWAQQAQETAAVRKAQEYQRVEPPPHTSNQWVEDPCGWHRRSNMVYRFAWRVSEHTHWDRAQRRSVTDAWELTWSVTYNTPDASAGYQAAGQSRKRFTDKSVLEAYLQGRIAAYDHLFQAISPPIPAEHRKRFCVGGVLLPGYTAEVPVEKAADSLMEFLEDRDILPEKPRRPPPKKPKRSVPTR